ncbi:MAG: uridine kinase [Verrucomicrobiota bacterium JB022]|nr:uridine kinase [Verrucomicrobiota bacterium JB022]
MSEPVYVIGFGGGSASGKSLLARWLHARLPDTSALLELDRYYQGPDDIPPALAGNYDHPGCLQGERFCRDVAALRAGQAVEVPRYDFTTHQPCGTEPFPPRPVLILDGVLLFALPGLRALIDLAVFVDAPADLRLARRLQRDVGERGRSAASVHAQFTSTVEPMHAHYVQPYAASADLVVSNTGTTEAAIESLRCQLREKASVRLAF